MAQTPGWLTMTVAVDGPAGVGKSTVSARAAEALGFVYLNSGNLYRAVTLAHLDSNRDPEDDDSIVDTARSISIRIEDGRITVDGIDVEDRLHSDEVDAWVSQHSAIIEIRHTVNRILREIAKGLDIIIEGRDIGTVVFPDAGVKIYLDADVEVRALRRFKQGISGKSIEELRKNIMMRDKIDSNKEEGSLKVAPSAHYIDTSHLTISDVCEKVTTLIKSAQ